MTQAIQKETERLGVRPMDRTDSGGAHHVLRLHVRRCPLAVAEHARKHPRLEPHDFRTVRRFGIHSERLRFPARRRYHPRQDGRTVYGYSFGLADGTRCRYQILRTEQLLL